MATPTSMLPMSITPWTPPSMDLTSMPGRAPMTQQDPASAVADISPQNPMAGRPEEQYLQLGLSKADIDHTVKIIGLYRDQWATDRIMRQKIWIKNVLFYRGIQCIDWHDGQQMWVNSLNWFSGTEKVRDGESTEIERFMHPITLMLGQTFIGNLAHQVPLTVVKPHDARILEDLTTAEAAQDAIGIIERRNGIRQMVRGEFEMLYLYGSYFKYTRGVLDNRFGSDDELIFGDIQVPQPAVMRCFSCAAETPVSAMPPAIDGMMQPCPQCGAPMGPESYFEGGPDKTTMGVVGVRKVPRAMVRQTIHSPLEIDADPMAKDLSGTPILCFDQEIDIGEARMMWPEAWDKIHEGQPTSTTPMADYDRLRRNETYAMGTGYTTDTNQQRPTYSLVWLQPAAYGRTGNKEYVQRMKKAAPDGLRISMLGSEVVGVKPAILTKEWSHCRLRENFGLYCQSIAENVTNFNERFNSAMESYDDYMARAAFGLNLVDGRKVDVEKWKGNTLAPTTVVPVPVLGNETLANIFQHFDIPVNPGLALYPQMLWMFCQLLNGLPAQLAGSGTNPDVDTYGGQNLQFNSAQTGIAPFWENVREEHAWAAQNGIECLQTLLKTGAAKEIWNVVKEKGSAFRNNYINFQKMRGHVDVEIDEDQRLPQNPEQIRQSFMTIFEEMGKQNAAAAAIFDVPANQEIIGRTLFPNIVSPVSAQRAKTLQDMNILLEQRSTPVTEPDGSLGWQLPVEPSIVEDFTIAIPTVTEFMIENSDLRVKNPLGWSQMEQYWSACQDMQAEQGKRKASRELAVRQAGAPAPEQPSPRFQQIITDLDQAAQNMIGVLGQLSQLSPMLTKGSITGQVAAAREVVDAALDATKALTK